MYSVLKIAGIVKRKYQERTGRDIEEIRLHKLLYFIQKESYVVYGKPLFEEDMEGWIYGPVSLEVRYHFKHLNDEKFNSFEVNEIINNVMERYGELSIHQLIVLSHQERPWKLARKGLMSDEIGMAIINKDEIYKEALRCEPFDELWGCRYDDYEDYE